MKVRVQLFAIAKDLAGRSAVDLELPEPATVADLRQALAEAVADLRPIARHLSFAVNADYALDVTKIPFGAEVACIPPVSGG